MTVLVFIGKLLVAMAIGQAAHAFEQFTGIAPHAARMEAHFRSVLKAR